MIFSEDFWKSEGEMKRVLPVSTGLSWVRMAPLLENAQRDYLVPLLGEKLSDEISWIYEEQQPSERSAAETVVLYLAQRAVANLAFWANFDALSLRISDQGFQRQESDSWKPAYKYQEDNLRQSFANTGFNALDQLLQQLEDHMEEFDAYEQSPAWLESQRSIVRGTDEVQDIYEINNSRLVYLRLLPVIRQVQELTLQPILGDHLYEGLVGYLKGDVPEDMSGIQESVWRRLRDHSRKVVVMAAVRQLLRTTGTITNRGAYFTSVGGGGGTQNTQPVPDARLSLLIADAERAMAGYTARLTSYVRVWMPEQFGGAPLRALDRDNEQKPAFWA